MISDTHKVQNVQRPFLNSIFYSRAKGLKSALIFDGIQDALKNDGASLVKKVKGVFGFKIKAKDGKEVFWLVDAKNGNGKVEINSKGAFFLIF